VSKNAKGQGWKERSGRRVAIAGAVGEALYETVIGAGVWRVSMKCWKPSESGCVERVTSTSPSARRYAVDTWRVSWYSVDGGRR
jgi:hypothetical protein